MQSICSQFEQAVALLPAIPPKPAEHRIERWNGRDFVPSRMIDLRRGHIFRFVADKHVEYRAASDPYFNGKGRVEIRVEDFAVREEDEGE